MKLNCFRVFLSAALLLELACGAVITHRAAALSPVSIELAVSDLASARNSAKPSSLGLKDLGRTQPIIEIDLNKQPSAREMILRDVTDPFKRMMHWARRAGQRPAIGSALSPFALRNGLVPEIISSLSTGAPIFSKTLRRRHSRQQTYAKRTRSIVRQSASRVGSPVRLDSGLVSPEEIASNDRVPDHVYDNMIKQAFEIPLSAGEAPLAVGVIRIENTPSSEARDSLQSQLGPFATVIREMLRESQPLVNKHYNEGNDLDEEDYHDRVVSPSEVLVRDPSDFRTARRDPLAVIIRKFLPIVGPRTSQSPSPQRLRRPILGSLPRPVDRLFRTFWKKQHHLTSLNDLLEHINSHPDKLRMAEALKSMPEQPGKQATEPNQIVAQQPELASDILESMKKLMNRMQELEKLKDLLGNLKESLTKAPKPPLEEQPKIDQSAALLQNVIGNIDGMKSLHQLINKGPPSEDPSKSPLIIRLIEEKDAPSSTDTEALTQNRHIGAREPVEDLPTDPKVPLELVTESPALRTPPSKRDPSEQPAAEELVNTMQRMIDTLQDLKPKSDKSKPDSQAPPALDPKSQTRINQMAQVLPLALLLSRQKQDKENFYNSLQQNNSTNNLNSLQNVNVKNNFEGPRAEETPSQQNSPTEEPQRKHHITVNLRTKPPANVVHVKPDPPGAPEDPCEKQNCDEEIKKAILGIEVEPLAEAASQQNH